VESALDQTEKYTLCCDDVNTVTRCKASLLCLGPANLLPPCGDYICARVRSGSACSTDHLRGAAGPRHTILRPPKMYKRSKWRTLVTGALYAGSHC
jgi:hypothetical protein